jgi:aerobic carbon-monoxide dehydrogenase large subunit
MKRINTFIGSPVERVEDLRYLRGRGQYVDDLVRPGQWHAAIVRSQVAHGRLQAIDTAAARSMRGVHAVITAQDLDRPIPKIPFRRPGAAIVPYAQPVLADKVVRYVGEPVAMLLADSAELAEDAAQAVGLAIEPLPVVADRRASMREDVRVIEGTESNCASVYVANAGDVAGTFRNAAYTRREQFRVQRMTAMTMETRGLLAEWDATTGRLIVSGAASCRSSTGAQWLE